MTEARTAYDYIGRYGRNPYDGDAVDGILVDHLADAGAHGAQPITSAAGTQSVLLWDANGNADVFPVVCGELIEISTEDGPATGRCGLPVLADGYACEGHTAEREDWTALSEPEKAAWERSHDTWSRSPTDRKEHTMKVATPAFKVTVRIEADSVFAVPIALGTMTSTEFLSAIAATGSIEPINEEAEKAFERARELLS